MYQLKPTSQSRKGSFSGSQLENVHWGRVHVQCCYFIFYISSFQSIPPVGIYRNRASSMYPQSPIGIQKYKMFESSLCIQQQWNLNVTRKKQSNHAINKILISKDKNFTKCVILHNKHENLKIAMFSVYQSRENYD
jgi:hypothetical protein